MAFIPVPRKINYTEAKGYQPNSLLSFMQKTTQKFVARKITDEKLGHDTYIYSHLATNQLSPQKPHYYPTAVKPGCRRTHIETGEWLLCTAV